MAYTPYQMKGPALYRSPIHKDVVIDGKTYPEGYTQADVDRLKEQNEDVVRREDLDEAGKKIFDANKKKSKTNKKPTPPKGLTLAEKMDKLMKEGHTQKDAYHMIQNGAVSATPFLGGLMNKAKKFAGGMLKGKDGKFGVGDVGRLALGPMGAVAGGLGLFKKGKKPSNY